eukprot:5997717-Amphidinium_carterae.2
MRSILGSYPSLFEGIWVEVPLCSSRPCAHAFRAFGQKWHYMSHLQVTTIPEEIRLNLENMA